MAGEEGGCKVDFLKHMCKMYSFPNLHKYDMRQALHEEWEEINATIWVCIGLISIVITWYHRVILI